VVASDLKIYIQSGTYKTWLLKNFCYNFLYFIPGILRFITSHWHQNGKLQFIDINLEQNKTLVSIYVTSNIENSVVLAVDK
jgi:hypothetical protein